jgi:hypothetical protein
MQYSVEMWSNGLDYVLHEGLWKVCDSMPYLLRKKDTFFSEIEAYKAIVQTLNEDVELGTLFAIYDSHGNQMKQFVMDANFLVSY